MNKIITLIITSLLLVSGCDKTELNTCFCENPIEELAWLKEIKNSLTDCSYEVSIIQGTYTGRTVFFTAITDPRINSIFSVELRDCNGSVVRSYDYDDYQIYTAEVSEIKVLFRCVEALD